MPHPTNAPLLRRRALLRWALASGLPLGLSACGGSADEPAPDQARALLQTEAKAGVADGLVGLQLGWVNAQAHAVAVAGKRRQGQDAPLALGDRLAIGSNTKAMTSAAILALAERGGPALQLRLPQALPEWADGLHPAYAQVTLADLLNHRAGLPAFDGSGQDEAAFIAAVDADTGPLPTTLAGRRAYFARWLLGRPPVTGPVPGSEVRYSNAGYVLAAAVVELRTGKAFETVFDEVLAQPLALQGAWRSMVPGPADTVWGHEGAAGALAVVEATQETLATKDWLDTIGPAGNWACTGADYAHWLHWHVRALRGERTPLPQAYVNDLRALSGDRYLWGWQALATPKRVLLTHTGHEPGFMAEVALDQAGDFAVFGLSNTGHVGQDGGSWVLSRIDRALSAVLKGQSVVL